MFLEKKNKYKKNTLRKTNAKLLRDIPYNTKKIALKSLCLFHHQLLIYNGQLNFRKFVNTQTLNPLGFPCHSAYAFRLTWVDLDIGLSREDPRDIGKEETANLTQVVLKERKLRQFSKWCKYDVSSFEKEKKRLRQFSKWSKNEKSPGDCMGFNILISRVFNYFSCNY